MYESQFQCDGRFSSSADLAVYLVALALLRRILPLGAFAPGLVLRRIRAGVLVTPTHFARLRKHQSAPTRISFVDCYCQYAEEFILTRTIEIRARPRVNKNPR